MKCRPVFACAQTARHIVRDWKQNILQEKKVVKYYVVEQDCKQVDAQNGPVAVGGEKKEAWELLAHYLHEMLKLTGIAEVEKNIRSLSIAMDSLNAVQVENLQRACRELGIPEERTILLDYEESFYYYRNLEQKCRLVQL